MTDLGDLWRSYKEYKKQVKHDRIQKMPDPKALLNEAGLYFEVKNRGEHYIVRNENLFVDYWPSTGYWKVRKSKYSGYNIRRLIKFINRQGTDKNE